MSLKLALVVFVTDDGTFVLDVVIRLEGATNLDVGRGIDGFF